MWMPNRHVQLDARLNLKLFPAVVYALVMVQLEANMHGYVHVVYSGKKIIDMRNGAS